MPLPGGASDKAGNRYEGAWTVRCLVEVLDETADWIRLEPPGEEGDKAEFVLQKRERSEHHQVKRQLTGKGHWTVADLIQKGVLRRMGEKLEDSVVEAHFISMDRANELGELSERAQGARTWEEFEQHFLKKPASRAGLPPEDGPHAEPFRRLREAWDCSEAQAWQRLRRVRVRAIDEETLRTIVDALLQSRVGGIPGAARDVLAQYALDSIHQELSAADLWRHLEKQGHPRRDWASDPRIHALIDERNKSYLGPLKREVISGTLLPRAEAAALVEALTSPDSPGVIIMAGGAGSGKSSLLVEAIQTVQVQGWPVLCFRLDRLEATDVPDQVGRQLALPGSPVTVLAAIAGNRDCLLVIDQLDAVSMVSGRNPQFFDCVDMLLTQASGFPNMRVVLASRQFDLDHDPRLKGLLSPDRGGKHVAVGGFPEAVVKEVVSRLGLQADRLTTRQVELLSVPLHLKLLSEVVLGGDDDVLTFTSVHDLFDLYWRRKPGLIRDRLGRSVDWAGVIGTLCDYLSGRQGLSAPEDVLDRVQTDAEVLASEYVLVLEDGKYSFFHESFFDYAFARTFVASGGRLLDLLRSAEQHLFRRAQVRQILIYLRETRVEDYLEVLHELLTAPEIRFHIKAVVAAWLGTLSHPREEEWAVVAPLLDPNASASASALALALQNAMFGSPAWFRLLTDLGVMQTWLASRDDDQIKNAIWFVCRVQRVEGDRVAELLEPYAGDPSWTQRIVSVLNMSTLGNSRRLFELFLQLVGNGTIPAGGTHAGSEFWSTIHQLSETRPEWACEAVGRYLGAIAGGRQAEEERHPFNLLGSDTWAESVISTAAQAAPAPFVEYVLPVVLQVISETSDDAGIPPWKDGVWRSRPLGPAFQVKDEILEQTACALGNLATNAQGLFRPYAEALRSSDYETAHFLLIRAYTIAGKAFASEAADYLREDPSRLLIGYSNYWHVAGRQLLEAISPHCTVELLAPVQDWILGYYPTYETRAGGQKYRGRAQFELLNGISAQARTEAATQRLREWQRKFEVESARIPEPSKGGVIGSPIPETAAGKMSDDQWLCALRKYTREDMRTDRHGNLVGGAFELSHQLEHQAGKEPNRFAALLLRFPEGTPLFHFTAVLRGITGKIEIATARTVCERCHGLPNRPLGQGVCDLIGSLSGAPLPVELMEMVAWYAAQVPEEADHENDRKEYDPEEILNAGISMTRGNAARVVGELLFADDRRLEHLGEPIRKLVADRSIAVRSFAAYALLAILRGDRDVAVARFLELCDTRDELLATPYVEQFIAYAALTHFDRIRPVIERMLASEISTVVTAGARQICRASLRIEEAKTLAVSCVGGSEPQRLGAVSVYASNVVQQRFREQCETALAILFRDSASAVRTEAARCFRNIPHDQLSNYASLVEEFLNSPSFEGEYWKLVDALSDATTRLPPVAIDVCEKVLKLAVAAGSNQGFHHSAQLARLVLRLYQQNTAPEARSQCLDLIDGMAQAGLYGISEELANIDR
jgi:hypothetical protein